MPLSLAEAAQATGLNRTTILRAIKSGRISGTKDDHGTWFVEGAELHRVFPPAQDKPNAAPEHTQPDAELSLRAALAEERLGELRRMLEEVRRDRDDWKEQAMRLALPGQQKPEPQSWWRWLRTTG